MGTSLVETPDLAFERLYETYARIVYRYALAVLRNPADAEDITQTTFLNAYRAMKAGEQPLMPRHWLLKIAHNACRMRWVRNSRRPQEVPLDYKAEQIVVPESERPDVRAVLNELGKLPFNQRSALVMRELEGRSYEEIADTLGVTVSSVEALLVRARRSMRLRRSAINVLGAVQLPASLESFFGSGAVATGGALAAGGVMFKAAAVLVAGVIAGGAGYTAVGATRGSKMDRREPRTVIRGNEQARASSLLAAASKPQAPVRPAVRKVRKHVPTTPKQQEPAPVVGGAQPAAVPVEPPLASPVSPLVPAETPTTATAPVQPAPPVLPASPAPQPTVPEPVLPIQPPPLPPIPPAPTLPSPPALPSLPSLPSPPSLPQIP
jgi:RNA polymerase sigma factor (sigma-70 family)